MSTLFSNCLVLASTMLMFVTGRMVIVAAFCLCVAHPGPAFGRGGYAKKIDDIDGGIAEPKV